MTERAGLWTRTHRRKLRDFAGAVARMVAAADLAFDPMKGADPNKGARYMHHQTTTETAN